MRFAISDTKLHCGAMAERLCGTSMAPSNGNILSGRLMVINENYFRTAKVLRASLMNNYKFEL